MTIALSKSVLHAILDYDPTTHRLTPKAIIPQGMPTVRTHGKHQLTIAGVAYSLAKIAYIYHHGKSAAKVRRKDGNVDNYAPDNLYVYKPTGRASSAPILDTIETADALHGKVYVAILRSPAKPLTPPTTQFISIKDQFGYAITSPDREYAKRVASKLVKNIPHTELLKIGAVKPTRKA